MLVCSETARLCLLAQITPHLGHSPEKCGIFTWSLCLVTEPHCTSRAFSNIGLLMQKHLAFLTLDKQLAFQLGKITGENTCSSREALLWPTSCISLALRVAALHRHSACMAGKVPDVNPSPITRRHCGTVCAFAWSRGAGPAELDIMPVPHLES